MSNSPDREAEHILSVFAELLALPTADGQRKRAKGKVFWQVDPGHEEALDRHLLRWATGERKDPDSGAHPLVHVAWRALALVAQEEHRGEPGWL